MNGLGKNEKLSVVQSPAWVYNLLRISSNSTSRTLCNGSLASSRSGVAWFVPSFAKFISLSSGSVKR